MPSATTVVVTGGAGFIGSHVVDRLLDNDYQVTVIDDLSSGKPENLPEGVELIAADITSDVAADAIKVVAPELIVHAAAQISVSLSTREPLLDARINVLGTVNVLEAARVSGTQKFVFFSSGGTVYGQPDDLPVSESYPTGPENPYGASKLTGELYLDMYRRTYGIESTVLRLANIYGPRQDPHGEAGVVAIFARAMLAGAPITIFGDGNDERDYVYVADVADAVIAAVPPGGPHRCNIGSGAGTNVNELCARLRELTGYTLKPEYGPPRPGDIHAISLDASLARIELGWTPKVGLETGLARTVEFFRQQVGSQT
ncbi:MAG TPA: NAD-dependent epimerase/dehydratase family protein [Dehalococcoidia bacterium]|jgi:UDP-glucose 4-epimerase|nr:UDP-glucose 4-epimerase [Chloroflexota bacterium]MDP5877988.1 NAD-dependent epimerase/dehydratase family protein [Dehalococcoidia bacterium]MDP6272874.1 NAD-dependent epimerase/dehydratase family protein [Dehalococcoidia bacterium]MDP7213768.1 NAD-dependent epimerase/dehydratase family protein [Dehalococcoidia bacterium]MDP7514540.1 NAD-dependent epimerase/dehydratase family protein [Dehalococcoidia bacterium]|tara:strand:+ start:678 stop:1622 length:945 start_codon:yes stop_codon:yes gene_type:complete